MNNSSYIKNIKALASLTPGKDDADFAAESLKEFKRLCASQPASPQTSIGLRTPASQPASPQTRPGTCPSPDARPSTRPDTRPSPRPRFSFLFIASLTSIAAVLALGIFFIAKRANQVPAETTELLASNEPIIVSSSISSTEYSTQAGEVKSITLEDGTKIWMNALSTIRVPKHFQKALRKVELIEGEAFFDVAHDDNAPFIVSTLDMDIKVLGTEFNIFAYKGYETKASLIRGSIKAYNPNNEDAGTVIKPNESITSTADGILAKSQISKSELESISWKDGKYIFDNMPLKDIAKKLELYYGTTITFADDTRACQEYSGKFRQGDGLDWILTAFQKAARFEYTYNQETNTIIIN